MGAEQQKVIGYRNISERYKNIILDVLEMAVKKDVDGDVRGYVAAVRHLAKMLQRYMPPEHRKAVNNVWKEMQEAIEDIRQDSKLSETVRQQRINKIQHNAASLVMSYCSEVITGGVIEEEITGTLVVGKTLDDIQDYAKKLREINRKASVDIEHYEEESP